MLRSYFAGHCGRAIPKRTTQTSYQVNGAVAVYIILFKQNVKLFLFQSEAKNVHGSFKLVLLEQARAVRIKPFEGLVWFQTERQVMQPRRLTVQKRFADGTRFPVG